MKQHIKESLSAAYHFRHACKEFDSNKIISDDDINFILETGRLSPSSFGFEPWKFLVIQNAQLKEQMQAISWGAQKQLPTASHYVALLSRTADDLNAQSDYLQNTMMRQTQHLTEDVVAGKSHRFDLFQKQDYTMTTPRQIEDWADKQTYLAFANMMTTAALLGIDSCPIEGFDYVKINDLFAQKGLLDHGHFKVAAFVAFGYRKADPARAKTRRPFNDVIQWIK